MLNYLKKFALEILPSVAATVIGAYIVNHYISKPATDAPVAAIRPPGLGSGHLARTHQRLAVWLWPGISKLRSGLRCGGRIVQASG